MAIDPMGSKPKPGKFEVMVRLISDVSRGDPRAATHLIPARDEKHAQAIAARELRRPGVRNAVILRPGEPREA